MWPHPARRRSDQAGYPHAGASGRAAHLGQTGFGLSVFAHRIRPPVTREALSAVEQGEDALRALGFRQFRVRHHGEIVRIEIAKEELPRALDPALAAEFTRIFKGLGFKFVTLDLEGFRSGSMNTLLPPRTCSERSDFELRIRLFNRPGRPSNPL